MSTYTVIDTRARVWECDNGNGDSLVVIAYPGRVTQVSRTAGRIDAGVTISDASEVPAEVATLREALAKLKGMDATPSSVAFGIGMVESVLAALAVAFPGCADAVAGGGV